MTWWKYKPLFEIKWREPYYLTRLVNKFKEKFTPWWVRPLWGVVMSAVLFVPGNFIKSENVSTGFVLLSSIIVGFGISYFIALVNYLIPSEIGFGEKAIVKMGGQPTQGWPYDKMAKVEFTKGKFRDKQFNIMAATMVNSRKLILGIPEKVDLDKIIEFLKSKGVEIEQIT